MRLLFFSQDEVLGQLVDSFASDEVVFSDDIDDIFDHLVMPCYVFLDFDMGEDEVELVNKKLAKVEGVNRVIVTSKLKPKDLKKHQRGETSADGYLIKPLSLEIINGILNDYQLGQSSDDSDENATMIDTEFSANLDNTAANEIEKVKEAQVDLDSTLNKNIQNTIDQVFEPDNGEDKTVVDSSYSDDLTFEDDTSAEYEGGLSPEDGTGDIEVPDELTATGIESTELDIDGVDIDTGLDSTQTGHTTSPEIIATDSDEDFGLEMEEEVDLGDSDLEFDVTKVASTEGSSLDVNDNLEENDDSEGFSLDDSGAGDLELGSLEISGTFDEEEGQELDEVDGLDEEEFSLDEDNEEQFVLSEETESPEKIEESSTEESFAEPLEVSREEEDDEVELEFGDDDDDDQEIDHTDPTVKISEESLVSELKTSEKEESSVLPTPPSFSDNINSGLSKEEDNLTANYNEDELRRLQATIRQLREEREKILKDNEELKESVSMMDHDQLTYKSEAEELKIELQILKKRHKDELEEANYQARLSDEKKEIYEQKAKKLQNEFDRLSNKVRIDFNKIKQREKELENQLEMVTMDSQTQVKGRDLKILELKRKIDSLEFNMENAVIKELRYREDKEKLEKRLEKIMKTLRGSIKMLEGDPILEELGEKDFTKDM